MQLNSGKQPSKSLQECKAVSVVLAAKAPHLLQLLEGLSGQPGISLLSHAMWLRGPVIDKMPPKLKLTHSVKADGQRESALRALSKREGSWTVWQEGLPMRGRGVSELPAAVRSITYVHCKGNDVAKFWLGMGFAVSSEALQDGHAFTLCLKGIQINVQLLKIYRLGVCNDLNSTTEIQPGQYFLEVTSMVANEDHISACKAIESLGGLMKHLCELQKP